MPVTILGSKRDRLSEISDERVYITPVAGLRAFNRALNRAMRTWAPPPDLTVTQSAIKYRYLSKESAARHGKYDPYLTPYLIEPMDCFNDPTIQGVILKTSAQVAKTTFLENIILHYVKHDPCPILLAQPTVDMAEDFSRERIAPLIRDCPALAELFFKHKTRGAGTLLQKGFFGGFLGLVGANSPRKLAGRPIRIVLGDEVSRWATTTEGDPITIIKARITGFWNGKFAFVSTPTRQGTCRISEQYNESDRRQYHIPCPYCEFMHVLKFENMRWDEIEQDYDTQGNLVRRCSAAWFVCPQCHRPIEEAPRHAAVRAGKWIAQSKFYGVAGFHLWAAYSPFMTAHKIISSYLAAQVSPIRREAWINTVQGEEFVTEGESINWEIIKARAEKYPPGIVPPGPCALTCGVDIQRDRWELYTYGWFGTTNASMESWLIDRVVFMANVTAPEFWKALTDAVHNLTYKTYHGRTIRPSIFAIDTRYQDSLVYDWYRSIGFPSSVALVQGVEDLRGQFIGLPKDTDTQSDGRRVLRGVKVWSFDASKGKENLYYRLSMRLNDDGSTPPGWFHTYEEDPMYYRQLTAEQQQYDIDKKTGEAKVYWRKIFERNEALDCFNMAHAAAHIKGLNRMTYTQWLQLRAHIDGLPGPGDMTDQQLQESMSKAQPPAQPTAQPLAQPPAQPPVSPPVSGARTGANTGVVKSNWVTGGSGGGRRW